MNATAASGTNDWTGTFRPWQPRSQDFDYQSNLVEDEIVVIKTVSRVFYDTMIRPVPRNPGIANLVY